MIKKIGVVARPDLRKAIDAAIGLAKHASLRGVLPVLDKASYNWGSDEFEVMDLEEMDVDMVFVFGGDGTVLRTVRRLDGRRVPLAVVDFGTTGFMAELPPQMAKNFLNKAIRGEYILEERTKLRTSYDDVVLPDSLNETVILTSRPAKLFSFEISVDGEWVDQVFADGVIVATPTGSTAYSLSAGGPIIHPQAKNMVITTICPFRSWIKTLVVPDTSEIQITPTTIKKILIATDGETQTQIESDNLVISIKKSPKKAFFAKPSGNGFYRRIREKLGGGRA